MKNTVLVVVDHVKTFAAFQEILEAKECYLISANSTSQAIEIIEKENCDLVIADFTSESIEGLRLLQCCQSIGILFIAISGYATMVNAIQALKGGAFDCLLKPLGLDQFAETIERALQRLTILRNMRQPIQATEKEGFHGLIARSKKMIRLFELISRIANSSSTILIQGESGTGKELIANAIHKQSPRRERPFVAINCSVLPEALLESELFGYLKGAFTGANADKKGLFEVAHTGTLFLDEIGEISPVVQTKLLRVLQEKEFKPLGSNQTIHVDVRVIAATNVDLREAVEKKTFRKDLYYRIAVIPLYIPPLRMRKDDILPLTHHFIEKYCRENGKPIKQIDLEALQKLIDYQWSGNIRELENAIERAIAIAPGDEITTALLPKEISGKSDLESLFSPEEEEDKEVLQLTKKRQEMEIRLIYQALEKTKGHGQKAAALLGICRDSLYKKMKKYGIRYQKPV